MANYSLRWFSLRTLYNHMQTLLQQFAGKAVGIQNKRVRLHVASITALVAVDVVYYLIGLRNVMRAK